ASADTEKVPSGSSFSTVAWTKDGTLLAGGTYKQRDGKHLILRWAEGGTGAPQVTVVAARDILLSIIPLSDGGFVYASADPGFGRHDAQQQAKIERLPEIIDVRDQHDKVRLSPDASVIGFGLEQFGRKPV